MTLVGAASPAPAQQDSNADLFRSVFGRSAPVEEARDLRIELRLQGARLGEIDVRIANRAIEELDRNALIQALESILAAERIEALALLEPRCTPEDLAALGLELHYDPVELVVELTVPTEYRKEWRARIAPISAPSASRQRYAAARTSAALNLLPGWVYDHDQGRGRGSLVGEGFVNVEGFALQGGFRWSSRTDGLQRQALVLHRDLPTRLLRLSAGELRSPAFGSQPGIPLRGFSISRNFDLDPYDPPFPGLLTPLLLEQPSEIEIRDGDRILDRFRLPAGPALLSDFPLGTGFNEIDVLILDDGRPVERLQLDGWFDRGRLGAGRQRFHFSLGQPWQQGARRPQRSGRRLSASGAYEVGLSDRLTLGSGGIYDGEARQFNGELQAALGFRGFSLRTSLLGSLRRSEFAPAVSIGLDAYPGSGRWQWQASGLWRGADYLPFGIDQAPGELLNLQARISRALGERWRFGVSHRYQRDDGGSSHALRSSLAFRASSSLSVQIAADARSASDASRDVSLNLFVSWRPRSGAHTLYAGIDDQAHWQAGWQANRQSSHGGSAFGVFLNEDDSGTNFSADARLRSHRGSIQIGHVGDFGSSAAQTRLSGGTALVYADGHVAIADRIGEAFALFAARPGSGTVYVNPNIDDWRSRSDRLGDAVVGDLTPYLERGFSLGLPELPVRSDPGDLQPVVQPEFLRGVVVPVGPVPSTRLRFRLLDAEGAPLALASGTLTRLEDDSVQRFFSNRDGEVQITGVTPGVYRIALRDGRVLLERQAITDEDETTDLGEFRP